MSLPIVPSPLVAAVMDRISACLARYRVEGIQVPSPEVYFDIKGVVAGKLTYQERKVQFNPVLLIENREKFVQETVGHEIAHLAARSLDPHCDSHGELWQSMMFLIGQQPKVAHDYDIRTVRKTVPYFCACQDHHISVYRHRACLRGASYVCVDCNTPISRRDKN